MLTKQQIFACGLLLLWANYGQAGALYNFNEPNTANLINALKNEQLHVVQLGDSHTAADEMTDAMRFQLQSALGNGGVGWGMPMYFSGQRMAMYGYDNVGWQPVSSRSARDENYTLGGFIAKPIQENATLTLKPKRFAPTQQFTVSIRQAENDTKMTGVDARGRTFTIEAPLKNNTWQTVQFNAQLPFTITAAQAKHSAIGGWWAKNLEGRGAIVSALGINGAELSFWNRWNRAAIGKELATIAPELVIIAYGTNEAFSDNLDIGQARDILRDKVRQIRQSSPNTTVMILSAPEALKNTDGQCGTRPNKLDAVQSMQLQVAQAEKTLFWDWQSAMGGSCQMKSWIKQDLARNDGVHFSLAGYQKLGRMLANDILDVTVVKPTAVAQQIPVTSNYRQNDALPVKGTGFAKICLEGSNECRSITF